MLQEQEDPPQEDWAVQAAKEFVATANASGLTMPIDAIAAVFRGMERIDPVTTDLKDVERSYSTEEVACFLDMSPQWVYWAMKPREENGGGMFYYQDKDEITGEITKTLIEPDKVGPKEVRRFDLDIIRDMAISWHQQAGISLARLEEIVARTHLARAGRWTPDPEARVVKPRRKKKGKKKSGPQNQGAD